MRKVLISINVFIGILIGISLALIVLLFIDDTNDKTNSIRIFAALINAVVLLLIAIYFTRSQNNRKSLKDYFVSDVTQLRNDYFQFLDEVEEDLQTKGNVVTKSKEFSMLSNQLTHTLKREFQIETSIEKIFHKILTILSGNFDNVDEEREDYFDNIGDEDIVSLSRQQRYLIAKEKKDLNLLLKNVVINITKV